MGEPTLRDGPLTAVHPGRNRNYVEGVECHFLGNSRNGTIISKYPIIIPYEFQMTQRSSLFSLRDGVAHYQRTILTMAYSRLLKTSMVLLAYYFSLPETSVSYSGTNSLIILKGT